MELIAFDAGDSAGTGLADAWPELRRTDWEVIVYQADARFETPADDAGLWRYMDVGRLIAMVRGGTLYFAQRDEFDDPWEGAFPESYKNVAYGPSRPPGMRAPAELDLHCCLAGINGWFEGEHESVAMWKLYTSGAEGIAVKTTVGRLKAALCDEVRPVILGRVRYEEYEKGSFGSDFGSHRLDPLFWKKTGYLHEREVRAVIGDAHGLLPEIEHVRSTGQAMSMSVSRRGVVVHLRDPASLFERVIVSQHYSQWAIPALQEVLDHAGLQARIELSSLKRGPSVFP